jgi:hypothetical protein
MQLVYRYPSGINRARRPSVSAEVGGCTAIDSP